MRGGMQEENEAVVSIMARGVLCLWERFAKFVESMNCHG